MAETIEESYKNQAQSSIFSEKLLKKQELIADLHENFSEEVERKKQKFERELANYMNEIDA